MTEVSGERSIVSGKERILDEHRRIREATQRIEESRELSDLLPCLREFRRLLQLHFVEEEAPGGLYDNISAMGPEDPGKLERLREEHRVLLGEMERVAEEARVCLEGPVAEVLHQVAQLARRLRKHEAGENALLMDAAYTDFGHGD